MHEEWREAEEEKQRKGEGGGKKEERRRTDKQRELQNEKAYLERWRAVQRRKKERATKEGTYVHATDERGPKDKEVCPPMVCNGQQKKAGV